MLNGTFHPQFLSTKNSIKFLKTIFETFPQSACLFTNVTSKLFQDDANRTFSNSQYCRENGCLQIIPGSHHLGRVNHGRSGDLASVDQERLDAIVKVLGDPVLVETDPGDVLFFHSNLLHTSGPNTSREKRWNLVLAYNQLENAPYHNKFLPSPSRISLVDDSDIVEKHKLKSSSNKHFICNKQDNSTEKL